MFQVNPPRHTSNPEVVLFVPGHTSNILPFASGAIIAGPREKRDKPR